MNKLDYLARLDEIEAKAYEEVKKIALEYLQAVNPYKAGDIIEDCVGKAQIECAGIFFESGNRRRVCIRYWCTTLTQAGKPAKRGVLKRFITYDSIENRKPLLED